MNWDLKRSLRDNDRDRRLMSMLSELDGLYWMEEELGIWRVTSFSVTVCVSRILILCVCVCVLGYVDFYRGCSDLNFCWSCLLRDRKIKREVFACCRN